MAKIKYKIVGNPNFLRSMDYLADLPQFMENFENEFQLAEEVNIEFEEIINSNPNKTIPHKLNVLEGGKVINLKFIEARYNIKGKVSEPSTPQEFYKGLKFYLENTVIAEDNKRNEKLNNTEEEE